MQQSKRRRYSFSGLAREGTAKAISDFSHDTTNQFQAVM